MPKIIAVIPARLSSTRLAEKLLLEIDGKSIVQKVYEQAKQSKLVSDVVIATDAQKIFDHAKSFGAKVEMTSSAHQSGTDRIAELAARNPDWDIVINVQGDEPFMNPLDIDAAVEPMLHDPTINMTSIYFETTDKAAMSNPSVVKLVTDNDNYAMYFSRALIPHDRDANNTITYKKHLGLYCYRRETVIMISNSIPKTNLEDYEKLEQLRALASGIKIKMVKAKASSIGIDTQEDYKNAIEIAAGRMQLL
ncbi:MAG: 3-deoxy-manno-octulosonate cytidylyltransferase [Candidatus Caenarcaniphilales bacterium]|jgi:3-deoxy-manno-octulosonate cytidylyltransferase (CMP-KDO synthetase)|nr:3-deoxy-manno-octulosonate cytidylyltransferase [Candidatus Caenarcaniphilales bacterium]